MRTVGRSDRGAWSRSELALTVAVALVVAAAVVALVIVSTGSNASDGESVVADTPGPGTAGPDTLDPGAAGPGAAGPDTPGPGAVPSTVSASVAPTVLATEESSAPVAAPSNMVLFDGVDDYIDLGAIEVDGDALTLEAWVRPDDMDNCASGDCRIISRAVGVDEQDHDWMLSTIGVGGSHRLRFRLRTDGVTHTLMADSGDLVNGRWIHVAATYDGASMQLFVNGTLVGKMAKSGRLDYRADASVWLGGNPPGPTARPWSGAVDDVRIWASARTEQELRSNQFTSDLTGVSGLVSEYRFETSGSTAVDDVGNNPAILGSETVGDQSEPVRSTREIEQPVPGDLEPLVSESSDAEILPAPPLPSRPNDVDASWSEAIATNDIWSIRAWYLGNTGFEAFYSDELGRTLRESDLTRIEGPLVIEQDNVVIEGAYITGPVTIRADNVVIRGSVIDIGGYTYGVHLAGSEAGENWTIDHVSFRNTRYAASQNLDDMANRPIYVTTSGVARFNQMLDGYSTGYYSVNANAQLWEYNFVDHIVRSPESHNTGMSIRTMQGTSALSDITVRRNLLLDGTSAPLVFYTDSTGLHSNVSFIENVVDLPYASSTNYCLYTSSSRNGQSYVGENVRFEGNIWGQSSSSLCGASGPYTGTTGDWWADNRYLDGTSVGG